MNRTLRVARLHVVPWLVARGLPWTIVASSFAINLLLFSTIDTGDSGDHQTGGLASLYVMFLVIYVRAMIEMFPFALGMGVTRRRFYTATSGLLVAESVAYGVVLYLLKLVEDATGGWGLSLRFFGIGFVDQDNPLAQIAVYAVPLLGLGFLGLALGAVAKRWGSNGMYALTAIEVLVFGGLATLITWRHGWAAVGRWFTDQSTVALLAGWPALLAALLAAAGFAVVRRAVP